MDHEFNTFESSFSGAPLPEVSPHLQQPQARFFPHAAEQAHPQAQPDFGYPRHQAGIPDWASDFQKLRISGQQSTAPATHFQPPSHHHMNHAADWQNEFNRQHPQQPTQTRPPFGADMGYGPAMGGMELAGPSRFPAHHEMSQPSEANGYMKAADNFDESAFEAAFAEAHEEVVRQERNQEQEEEFWPEQQTERIGSDRIPHPDPNDDEAEGLAQAATHLLDSVSHDQSQKFRESNFLALMRQFRDREAVVDGNTIRQVSTPP